nr:LOW QUALITY PROTEIN: mediator of RNA polymerase II transcription subunit 7 [Aedes albopictus]
METTENTDTIQVSSFPLPPAQYYKLFTDENIRNNRAPKPPAPIQGTYQMFGQQFSTEDNIIRPLEAQGFKRLYPQHFDRKKELKKLNHSLLVNFLDLIDLLVHNPDSPQRAEKIEDLNLLFVHIHHLLNEFRPHQARETLRVMMELQQRQRIETAQRFQNHLEKVREMVNNAFASLPDPTESDRLGSTAEPMDTGDEGEAGKARGEGCHPVDRLMCELVENM